MYCSKCYGFFDGLSILLVVWIYNPILKVNTFFEIMAEMNDDT